MSKIKIYNANDAFEVGGSYKLGTLVGVKHKNLIEMFGEPTFVDPSIDQKVQFEWVVKYDNSIYTVYDWKTYDAEYTLNELTSWSIGGKGKIKQTFIDKVFSLCKEKCDNDVNESIMFHSLDGLLEVTNKT